MPRFDANLTMLFTEVPFPERFAAAARAGFDAVEFLFPYDYSPRKVSSWLTQSGLRNVLFNLWPGEWSAGDRGLASLPARRVEFRESVTRAMEYADALNTPCLHAMAGIVPAGADRTKHRQVYLENIRFAANELAKDGRTLLIEAINTRDMPGYFLNTQADAHAIVDEIALPNVKVQFDFYHTQIAEGDVATKLRKYVGRVGHIQIAGVPHRHEPDSGDIDYGYLLPLIDKLGYSGWVGCEYVPRGRTDDGLKWIRKFAIGEPRT